ncbi:MAG: ATP-binding cassette domain-containing protein [Candidatus Omnitrophota bacterium]
MSVSTIIDLKNISIRRGGNQVLKGFSWSMRDDQNWFIMGNNGCGKSTLLEIIAGYLWPQSGRVRVFGETYGEAFLPDLRKKIGYVAPWVLNRIQGSMSVEEVIASGLEASIGVWGQLSDAMMNKVDAQLEFFQIQDLRGRCFGLLSTGQQLKVALARARINNPRLLILDEPFSTLDIGTRMKTYALMEKMAHIEHGTRVIMVTHHLDDIVNIFTHGMILKGGVIFKRGVRDRVLNRAVLNEAFDSG